MRTYSYALVCRNIIRRAVNAGDKDAVIFTGSGSTGAIDKLVRALAIKFEGGPRPVSTRHALCLSCGKTKKDGLGAQTVSQLLEAHKFAMNCSSCGSSGSRVGVVVRIQL